MIAPRKQSGFSLIELSIVLLIVGMLMSGFLSLSSSAIQGRQNAAQREIIDGVKTDAILQAINSKSAETICIPGSCSGVLASDCIGDPRGPCRDFSYTYAIPNTVAGANDAWGNPVTYTRTEPAVTSTTPPSTLVFSIRSNGPDATNNTADDLVYVVTASELLARIARMGL